MADTTLYVLQDSEPPATEFWSGCAYGVDSIGIAAAVRARVPLIGFSLPQIREGDTTRPLFSNADDLIACYTLEKSAHWNIHWVLEYAPPGRNPSDGYLKRDSFTVSKIDRLLAFPRTSKSELRSGTWATIRRARDAGVEIWFYPLDRTEPWVEVPDPVERMTL